MKRVAVTGGAGFVGRHLINELLSRYPDIEVTSISRSEALLTQLLVSCPSERLKIALADVRDIQAMKFLLTDMDTVIHLAAMKRVELCEEHSREAITINVIGMMNILDAFEGSTFVLMSTDKAVEPAGCYGASKLLCEKLVLEQANKQNRGTRFMIVRSGNVAWSTGSVLEIWKQQIEQTNEITVTDPNMTRFFTSAESIVDLIISVVEQGESGKVYLTSHGPAKSLRELVEEATKLYGDNKTTVKIVGRRPGERLHEKLRLSHEQYVVIGFTESLGTSTPLDSGVFASSTR